jgi:hypothetical protein
MYLVQIMYVVMYIYIHLLKSQTLYRIEIKSTEETINEVGISKIVQVHLYAAIRHHYSFK